MIGSLKYFGYFFRESLEEVRSNLNIFAVYIGGLFLVSIISNFIDFFFLPADLSIKILSKFLFSMVPILVLAKLLYVMKIRISALGEYSQVLLSFLFYNILYLFITMLAFALYLVPSTTMLYATGDRFAYAYMLFLLFPLIYIMIYYSLTPFVAVFEESGLLQTFKTSYKLTRRDVLLVLVNHLFALSPHLCTPLINAITMPAAKFSAIITLGLVESVLAIVMTITTVKIFFHLINLDEIQ